MKILMLGWELPPYNSGGLGTACYQLCKALSKKDVDIEFIVPYEADHGIDFMKVTAATKQDVETFLLSGNAYDSEYYHLWEKVTKKNIEALNLQDQVRLYEEAVASMVADKEYDVVHAHDWLTFKAALRLKASKKWPIILHVHSVESDRAGSKQGNPLVMELESISLHMADRVIAVSEHTKRCIHNDYGVPLDKIEVVHNSIDLADIEPLDADNSYKYVDFMKGLGYRVVVSVGRLTVQKGLPNLLLAARKVVENAPKTLFVIVGSGEQYYELIEQAAALGIGPNVLFTDFQRGKTWRDAFAIGDLFVMPSLSEPFGITPLESVSYGTPALISKQSGVGEVLRNCLKVDFWDIDEMANQIANVMQSDPLRDTLQQNALDELDNISWSNSGDKIMSLYAAHAGATS
ncbi:MAG TPA: glycosyltransferase family 4 protein [Candidatus Saccharimonadales bacterium]|nr:glycosyltransferase family 4 protein [Candidatus Saccharimonadales bacterium]